MVSVHVHMRLDGQHLCVYICPGDLISFPMDTLKGHNMQHSSHTGLFCSN